MVNLETIEQPGIIEIHNALGKLILTERVSAEGALKSMNLSHLSNGIYHLPYLTEAGILFSEKFVKQ